MDTTNTMPDKDATAHSLPNPDDIVISGMAGTFPASQNIEEFEYKLYNKIDLTSPSSLRNLRHPDCPPYLGFIPTYRKFDAGFFGMHRRESIEIDPQLRIILEKTIECLLDAGIHPTELENTNTGIFSGVVWSESEAVNLEDCLIEGSMVITGHGRSFHSERVGYFLKTKGPCFNSDTACSSSLYALAEAIAALDNGECDRAIVIGTNLCIRLGTVIQFYRLGVISPTGCCRPFDEASNGYVRADAVVVILLQKAKEARRIYAQIVHIKTNCDGFKDNGIHYPSGEAQIQLYKDFYDECGIPPSYLSYLETHGTGTRVGDFEECFSIDKIFSKNRDQPLLIGTVKSSMGHSEGASGLVSIVKAILALDKDLISPNINYDVTRTDITSIVEGRLSVVKDNSRFSNDRRLIGINSFGFGGANCHLLLRGFKFQTNTIEPNDDLPRLVCVSGRTINAISKLLDDINEKRLNSEYIKLFHSIYRKKFTGHQYRGYIIVSKTKEIMRSTSIATFKEPTLYVAFGELANWYDIINDFRKVPLFQQSLLSIEAILRKNSLQIENTILSSSLEKRKLFDVAGQIITQICLVHLLKGVLVSTTEYIENFLGILISSYVNGKLELDEVVEYALWLNKEVNENTQLPAEEFDHLSDNLLMLMKRTVNQPASSIREVLLQHMLTLLQSSNKYKGYRTSIPFNLYFHVALFKPISKNIESLKPNSYLLEFGSNEFDCDVEDIRILNPCNQIEGFLKTIGRLYELGYEVALDRTYPEVKFPISSGSPRLNSKIDWNHNFHFAAKIGRTLTEKHHQQIYKIDLNTSEWNYVTGHNIDGRLLFPAAGYLYLAWNLLSKRFFDVKNTPIVFENCRFMRATTLNQKEPIRLQVSVNSTGCFEITESDSVIVTGKMSSDLKDFKKSSMPQSVRSDKNILTSKNIYKELRLRGYNYSGLFRSIESFDSKRNIGKITWSDNFVSFLDNLFQLKILQVDTRSLFVPIFIKKLAICPEIHIAIGRQQKDNGISEFSAHYDPFSDTIRSGGIEIQGLLASAIARKRDLAIPVLEQYEFVPNETKLSLDKSVRVNMQIILENISINKISCLEILKSPTNGLKPVALSPVISEVLEDQPTVQGGIRIFSKEPVEVNDIPVEDKDLKKVSKEYMLLVATNLLKKSQDLEESLKAIKDNGYIISREDASFKTSTVTRSDLTILTVHRTELETLVLLRKSSSYEKPVFINIKQNSNLDWLLDVQKAIESNEKIVVYAENESDSGLLGFVNCVRKEPNVSNIKGCLIMDKIRPFDPSDNFFADQLNKNLAINVYKNGSWGTYRHLKFDTDENIPSKHCYVNQIVKGDLSSLRWMEGPIRTEEHTENFVESLANVHYAALNFRDVMLASGKITVDAFTKDRMKQEGVLGLEYSGIDFRGKRIMGMVGQAGLSTIVKVDEVASLDVPIDWSLEEAATVPVVYATVIYALEMRVKIHSGCSILIHSGLGGVGQAAIRYALHYGCSVFATVGNENRKKRLQEIFPQLPDCRIGNSHDTSFERMIMKETHGRGVDIILNSLAEEKLLASVRCLAKGGTFLEIGKFDMTQNNQMNLQLLHKSVSFHGVMLDHVFSDRRTIRQIFDLLERGIANGSVKPLEREIFKHDEVEQAFRHMASGKHLGKVLLQINRNQNTVNGLQHFDSTPRYYCHPKKSYIIIGGLGGFGLELCDWLILRGAKNVVLVSRTGIKDGYQAMRLSIWSSYGVNVNISTANVSRYSGCIKVVEAAAKLGPVGGIFNLAVVLEDALIENQTVEKYKNSLTPKATTTKYFDEISRKLCPELSEFVVFSSVSCGRGNSGQTNYGMANSIMERICENRKRDGYPALAIQWGAIGEVGIVAEKQMENIEIEIGGTLQQKISSCLQVMDLFLRQKSAVIVSSMVVAEKRKKSSSTLVESVAIVLGVTDVKAISFTSTLAEIGMDSMAAVEIKQFLETDYEIFLTPKQIRSLTFAKLDEYERGIKNDESEEDESKISFPTNINLIDPLDCYRTKQVFNVPLVEMPTKISIDQKGPTVFFVPGIEGFAELFIPLCKEIKAHAYVLQQNYDDVPETIFDMAQQILPLTENYISSHSKFLIVAYSYGTAIALELVSMLEAKGYSGTLLCIDGSPVPVKRSFEQFYKDYSGGVLENIIISNLLTNFGTTKLASLYFEMLSKCETTEKKFEVLKENIETKISISLDNLRSLADGLVKRCYAISFYAPSFKKIKSKVVLYKPMRTLVTSDLEDYGLSDLCGQIVDVNVLEGDHYTILENNELIDHINELLSNM